MKHKTADEILDEMAHQMPFVFPVKMRPYVKEAMTVYAAQHCRAYQTWLCNQVIVGCTSEKLWMDYLNEVFDK